MKTILILILAISSANAFCFSVSFADQYDCHDDVCGKLKVIFQTSATSTFNKCVEEHGNVTQVVDACKQVSFAGCDQAVTEYNSKISKYLGCSTMKNSICPVFSSSGAQSALTHSWFLIVSVCFYSFNFLLKKFY
jgi:hypothetical protein